MSVVFILLPVALLVVFAAIAAYVWAARSGQYDDLTTPALRILHEEGEETERRAGPSGRDPEGRRREARGTR